jgi:hypothetical protein
MEKGILKASEFRIGNYIYYFGVLEVVDINFLISLEEKRAINQEIIIGPQPIKIDEDWLKRLGLTKWDGCDWWKHSEDSFELALEEEGYYLSINLNEYITAEPIHYIHQLQNLYFALYQKELTIKEK